VVFLNTFKQVTTASTYSEFITHKYSPTRRYITYSGDKAPLKNQEIAAIDLIWSKSEERFEKLFGTGSISVIHKLSCSSNDSVCLNLKFYDIWWQDACAQTYEWDGVHLFIELPLFHSGSQTDALQRSSTAHISHNGNRFIT